MQVRNALLGALFAVALAVCLVVRAVAQDDPEPTPEPTGVAALLDGDPYWLKPFCPGGVFGVQLNDPFLPDIEGTYIFDSKKNDNIQTDEQPLAAGSYTLRQEFITVPGLYVGEGSTSPFAEFGNRGMSAFRSQSLQMRVDHVPLAADIFSYPEAYYFPALPTIGRIEFVRGGSALLYGPSPGGSLNFVTRQPVPDKPVQFDAENAGGSFGFFSTYESVSGTVGQLGYTAWGTHQQSDGFREFNNRSNIDSGGAQCVFDLGPSARIIFGADMFSEGHGDPGGLTFDTFRVDPDAATRRFDSFQNHQNTFDMTYQQVLAEGVLFETTAWAITSSQFTKWQNNGGAPGFGGVPLGTTSTFVNQDFFNVGVEPRVRVDYNLLDQDQPSTFTAGLMYYHVDSPREDSIGPVAGNAGTTVTADSDRHVNYFPVYAESILRLGPISIVPGIRLENVWQSVQPNIGSAPSRTVNETVVLMELGLSYKINPKLEMYANISQSYQPFVFNEAVVPGANTLISGDLEPNETWQMEIGFRGHPVSYLTLDTSLFYINSRDQVGSVTGPDGMMVLGNVGDAWYRGWELGGQIDLSDLSDQLLASALRSKYGSLGVFCNSTLLDAEYYRGPLTGRTPAYAPDYMVRSGVTYAFRREEKSSDDLVRLWLTGTFIDDAFGQDDNATRALIPQHSVWDFTGEASLWGKNVRVFGGVYNLFNTQYIGRVLGTGVDPGLPRNFFGGVKVLW